MNYTHRIWMVMTLLLALPGLVNAQEKFPIRVESMTSTTVTLTTERMPAANEWYRASCSPYTGHQDTEGFTKSRTMVVPALVPGTRYTCTMYTYPTATGGQTQEMSMHVTFVAGDRNSVAPLNTPPSIVSVYASPNTGTYTVGQSITWTVNASDRDGDVLQYYFGVCRLDDRGGCHAVATAGWSGQSRYQWSPTDPGSYQLQVLVIDGKHQPTSYAWGDDEYLEKFRVVAAPVVNTPVVVARPVTPTVPVVRETPTNPVVPETPTPVRPTAFTDMQPDTLESRAAVELRERGIVGGYADGTFRGGNPVNRAETAKFLLETLYEHVYDLPNSGKFWDLQEGAWYIRYIMVAADMNIIGGYADGSFRPEDTVNTAEFLKMMALTFRLPQGLPHNYTDVPGNAWYAPYAGIAQEYGLFPDRVGRLEPAANMTRREVVIAIYSYLQRR